MEVLNLVYSFVLLYNNYCVNATLLGATCPEFGNVIVEELVNTPRTDSIDIRLDKTINTIINPLYAYEIRLVTFEYDYNATDTKTEEYIYKLINMVGIPMPGAG